MATASAMPHAIRPANEWIGKRRFMREVSTVLIAPRAATRGGPGIECHATKPLTPSLTCTIGQCAKARRVQRAA
ncbi:hypothetical protein WS75_00765 [Burkholderia sp. FL-7-2-10-S1-D7]|nr:hypothetical protein WS75_00765 [Burkholderia sp. FL-7-2-10-S1-D7]